jgi:hypothetical protein
VRRRVVMVPLAVSVLVIGLAFVLVRALVAISDAEEP